MVQKRKFTFEPDPIVNKDRERKINNVCFVCVCMCCTSLCVRVCACVCMCVCVSV